MPSKPSRSALGFLAVFGGLFIVLALVRGCGRPRPADLTEGDAGERARLSRRVMLGRRERALAAAVDTYRPADARLDDLSRPAVEILRGLPGVARVATPLAPTNPTRRLVHLLDWHLVSRPAFAGDARAANQGLSEADVEARYADHLLTVEDVRLHQAGCSRYLAYCTNVKTKQLVRF
jgi:hypothetical protein